MHSWLNLLAVSMAVCCKVKNNARRSRILCEHHRFDNRRRKQLCRDRFRQLPIENNVRFVIQHRMESFCLCGIC